MICSAAMDLTRNLIHIMKHKGIRYISVLLKPEG